MYFVARLNSKDVFKKILLGILGFIGASVVLFLTSRNGAGTTPDSVAYISAARNLAADHGFLIYDDTYLVAQPPLYPIILAVIKKTTFIDPQVSAGYLNALLFGLIIYFSGLILLRYLNSYMLVVLGTVSMMISCALVQASLMALTESLFIFTVILFLYYFEKYQAKKDFVSFFLFSISVSMACLTRYTGVIIILAGIVSIYFWGKNTNKEKYWHSIIFILITGIPIGIWIVRNYFLSGTFIGQRASSSYTLMQNMRFYYQTVFPWYLPLNLTGIYFIFLLLIITTWILSGLKTGKSWGRESVTVIGPSLLFVIFYSVMIVVSSTTTAYDKISDRLLSPLYVPIIFILFFVCDKIFDWLAKSVTQKFISVLFILSIVVLMRYHVNDTTNIIEEYVHQSGWGYTSEHWKKSETINYLSMHKILGKSYNIYSNEPSAVYILTNLQSKSSPAKTYYNSSQLYFPKPVDKNDWLKGEKVCLIWFDNANRNFLYTIDELQKNKDMVEIARLKDGKIYKLGSK